MINSWKGTISKDGMLQWYSMEPYLLLISIIFYPTSGKFPAIWLVEKNRILCCIILLAGYYFNILFWQRRLTLLTSPRCFKICWCNIQEPKAIGGINSLYSVLQGRYKNILGRWKKLYWARRMAFGSCTLHQHILKHLGDVNSVKRLRRIRILK